MRVLDVSKLYDMTKDELIELIKEYDKFKRDVEQREAIYNIIQTINR